MASKYDSRPIDLTLEDAMGQKRHFTTIRSLREFLEEERKFWGDLVGKSQNFSIFQNYLNSFQSIAKSLNQHLGNLSSVAENALDEALKSRILPIQGQTRSIQFSGSPIPDRYLEILEYFGPQAANSFWTYVSDRNSTIGNMPRQNLEGAILGYEYINQEESRLLSRRKSEEESLSSLREKLSDYTYKSISEAESQKESLRESFLIFKKEFEIWDKATKEDLETKIKEFEESKDDLEQQSLENMEGLELIYKEKLKLEGPADYWKRRAQDFKNSGTIWGSCFVLSILGSGLVFSILFHDWLTSGKTFETLSATHFQGVLLLGAVISIAIFLIRLFSKLTFSSVHLQRDAEEREQLSYLYLALNKDTEMSDQLRAIILQSLFSRSDSGLLSGDNGPILPAAEIIKQMNS